MVDSFSKTIPPMPAISPLPSYPNTIGGDRERSVSPRWDRSETMVSPFEPALSVQLPKVVPSRNDIGESEGREKMKEWLYGERDGGREGFPSCPPSLLPLHASLSCLSRAPPKTIPRVG